MRTKRFDPFIRTAAAAVIAGAAAGAHAAELTGPSSSQAPYLQAVAPQLDIYSILSVTDAVQKTGAAPGTMYQMVGLPDGLGAYDNDNGTFTILMNHEIGSGGGVVRAHGANGAFVSEWIVDKNTFQVVSGRDLISTVKTWNGSNYVTSTVSFARFCSADLPAVSAFFNAGSGLGTQERIFMNGEENGTSGRAWATVATGAEAGTAYQLPRMGKYSFENSVANPFAQDKTIVAATDDTSPNGQVYLYIGTKTNTGTAVDKAGLTNGSLFGIKVDGVANETRNNGIGSGSFANAGTFSLFNFGDVSALTGAQLETQSSSNGVTGFLRPEDAAWDPDHPENLYFVTTDTTLPTGRSRLYSLSFDDITNPTAGGTIQMLLEGLEGGQMYDNITVHGGKVYLEEDVGNNSRLGRIWEYDIVGESLTELMTHDANRFVSGGGAFLTQDEEASGVISLASILGEGWFATVDQAHYGIGGQFVEGGQLSFFHVIPEPATMGLLALGALGLVRRRSNLHVG